MVKPASAGQHRARGDGRSAAAPVRADGLVSERVGAELLVYDAVADAAHCLSADAALVFEACDGLRDAAGLCAATGLPAETVKRALGDLDDLGLMGTPGGHPTGGRVERVRRREALKRLAKVSAAAATAPLIVSAVLDTPAAFASGGSVPEGGTCMGSGGVDNCITGYNCDPTYSVCVSQACNIVPTCTVGDVCDNSGLPGRCFAVAYGTGSLCC
jgi:hypothetical protein